MKNRMAILPALFLGSGAAFTVVGLALIVAYGAAAPIAALVCLVVGLLDGATGLIWALAMLFAKKSGGADPTLVLVGGLLSVIFLGAVLALLLYLHVLVGCLRNWGII